MHVNSSMLSIRVAAAALALGAVAGGYWALSAAGVLDMLLDPTALRGLVARFGFWGPLVIIAGVSLSVVASPLPGAPFAVAAGAAYGHFWGTAYVVTGAEAGALAAFGIARLVGAGVVHRWFGERSRLRWLGSQNTLMGLVFVSRLLPFVSFDVISYAAGLTPISAWRFALATLAGILPTGFFLAHLGGEMVLGEAGRALAAIAALGLLVLVPLVIGLFRERPRKSEARDAEDRRSRS